MTDQTYPADQQAAPAPAPATDTPPEQSPAPATTPPEQQPEQQDTTPTVQAGQLVTWTRDGYTRYGLVLELDNGGHAFVAGFDPVVMPVAELS